MSTKTTFKRIALVAVAALGFGVLTSVAPASAGIASALSINTNSMTAVGGFASSTDTPSALIKLKVTSDTASTGLTQNESITARVTAVPTASGKTLASNKTDLQFLEATGQNNATTTNWTLVPTGATAGSTYLDSTAAGSVSLASDGVIGAVNSAYYGMDGLAATETSTAKSRTYYMAISPTTSSVLDAGVYTVSFTLTNSVGVVIGTQTLSIDFVSAPAVSGSKISVAAAGTFTVNETLTYSTTHYVKATLTNRDGGVIRGYKGANESIYTDLLDSAGDVTTVTVNNTDTGTTDFGSSADENQFPGDGVYGLRWGSSSAGAPAAAGAYTIRARHGAASGTAAITVYLGTGISSTGTMTVTTTGASVLDAGNPYNVPLTTKSATFTVSTSPVAVNVPVTFTTTWTGVSPAGDVSPVSGSTGAKVVFTDALGKASITVTNSNPQDTSKASVTASGLAADVTNSVQWDKAAVTTITVSPAAQKVKYLSTNVVTAVVTDQWGAPIAGVSLQPTITGANAPTAALATVVTDATGSASITVTDAAATATTTTDTVKFTNTASGVNGSTVLTYVTTVPVIGTLTGYYNLDDSASTFSTPVPATGIYNDNVAGTKLIVTTGRDTTKSVATSSSATDDLVAFRFIATDAAGAAVAGVPVVVTVSKGGYIKGSSTLRVTSRTIVSATNGYVDFVGGTDVIGDTTFTVTAGTVVSTATIKATNAASAASARFVTITGSKTGVSNGEANSYSVLVSDRYGNPVSGVTLSLQATGVAVFQGGSTLVSFTTDTSGTVTFKGTSYTSAGGVGTFKVAATTPTAQFLDVAGYVSTTAVDSALAAGNASTSLDVTFAEGASAAETNAQAAADAAAEATDAANAATDAANAAAEAADAATAAAQDAADAVAALSTQVSEMVSALKKQITALTNLVIKIQKKVKA